MPNPSELARLDAEREPPVRTAVDQTRAADAYETLLKRANALDFDTIGEALDFVEQVQRGEL
jgi:hypothetical protein